jgi:hypothetical protein
MDESDKATKPEVSHDSASLDGADGKDDDHDLQSDSEQGADSEDKKDQAAKRALKKQSKEERKKKLEEEKKEKRKAKKQAKDVAKKEQFENIPTDSKHQSKKATKAHKGEPKTEEICEKVPEEAKTEEIIEGDLIEIEAKDAMNTAFKVGKDTVVVQNTEMEKLEAVRKQRERDEREREAELKKKELMKEQSKSELQKLQEKLALKNQLKNKKGKKR